MCLIIDANLASKAFAVPTHVDFKPVIEWLTSSRKNGKLVLGGELSKELDKVTAARRFVRALAQAGRVRLVPEQVARKEASSIRVYCVSNDSHVIALARISGARLLCSLDQALHKDFTSTNLISNPKGHIYKTRAHEPLLRLYGHTEACRRILGK